MAAIIDKVNATFEKTEAAADALEPSEWTSEVVKTSANSNLAKMIGTNSTLYASLVNGLGVA